MYVHIYFQIFLELQKYVFKKSGALVFMCQIHFLHWSWPFKFIITVFRHGSSAGDVEPVLGAEHE
jgi:hypothetical protein